MSSTERSSCRFVKNSADWLISVQMYRTGKMVGRASRQMQFNPQDIVSVESSIKL